jgi:hypothetical protein
MSTRAVHAPLGLAEGARRAPCARRGDHILSDTRPPNMPQNLPESSRFDCGDRHVIAGDVGTDRDARRMATVAVPVVQIRTITS